MSTTLLSLIANPPSGRSRAVLFDHHDYAQQIILQGREVPWESPMAYSNFFGQAQALLTADAALLDLGRFYAEVLAKDPVLTEAMGARSRTGYALRTLLGDEGVAERAVEIATTFTRTQSAPVLLKIPSPMQWLARAHQHAGRDGVADLDADDAEKAAMYVADWIRSFAGVELAGVLLDDRQALGVQVRQVEASSYAPVSNVTDYYRWPLALQRADGVQVLGEDLRGALLGPDFWTGEETSIPQAAFLTTQIPRSAQPEAVVSRVALLT